MNTDGTCFHTCKEYHKTESLWNHTTTEHKEGEQLEDRRSVGASSCNCGDGTDQRVQSLLFAMMMIFHICCVLTVHNTLHNFDNTQRDGLSQNEYLKTVMGKLRPTSQIRPPEMFYPSRATLFLIRRIKKNTSQFETNYEKLLEMQSQFHSSHSPS